MKIFMETISKHRKDKKVTGNSQYRFMKGKSLWIAFCNEIANLVTRGRTIDLVVLDCSKAVSHNTTSPTVSHSIIAKYKLDKWAVR